MKRRDKNKKVIACCGALRHRHRAGIIEQPNIVKIRTRRRPERTNERRHDG